MNIVIGLRAGKSQYHDLVDTESLGVVGPNFSVIRIDSAKIKDYL